MLETLPSLRGFRPRGSKRTTPWSPLLPFAYDLVAELRPRLLVELGTHTGESYFAFCQSVRDNATATICHAVDTWCGDRQTGSYEESVFREVAAHNREHYADFSYLLRTTFDQAAQQFSDASVGLLHIDGLHTYEAVRRDYETWLPKMRDDGIVLLHDIAVRRPSYGVWRLWEEIARPGASFAFDHGCGLGVIKKSPEATFASDFLNRLFAAGAGDTRAVRNYYALVADSLALGRIMDGKTRRRRMRRALEARLVLPLRALAQALGRPWKDRA